MDRERVFISSENIATFICPSCKKNRNADVSKIISFQSAVKINCKCKCGHKFSTILERRRFFRKDIELPGHCFIGEQSHKVNVYITDISRSGIKVQMDKQYSVRVGDELLVEFKLDDNEQSLISKKIVIRSIKETVLGAEFKSPEHYDKLGSYLMFY